MNKQVVHVKIQGLNLMVDSNVSEREDSPFSLKVNRSRKESPMREEYQARKGKKESEKKTLSPFRKPKQTQNLGGRSTAPISPGNDYCYYPNSSEKLKTEILKIDSQTTMNWNKDEKAPIELEEETRNIQTSSFANYLNKVGKYTDITQKRITSAYLGRKKTGNNERSVTNLLMGKGKSQKNLLSRNIAEQLTKFKVEEAYSQTNESKKEPLIVEERVIYRSQKPRYCERKKDIMTVLERNSKCYQERRRERYRLENDLGIRIIGGETWEEIERGQEEIIRNLKMFSSKEGMMFMKGILRRIEEKYLEGLMRGREEEIGRYIDMKEQENRKYEELFLSPQGM